MIKTNGDNNKSGKLFNIFSSSHSRNPGVTKEQARFDGKYNFYNFFSFLKFRFGDLTILNLTFILTNFVIILVLFATSGNTDKIVSTPASPFFQQIFGIVQYDSSSVQSTILNLSYGANTTLSVWTTVTKILYYSAFLLLITFGLSNIGMAYVTRGFVRREHSFVWHDYWYAVKRDWKQGLVVGIIDCVMIYLIAYALTFYYANLNNGGYMINLMFYMTIAVALLYLMMRIYMYLMVITFNLKFTKLIKNAMIFTLLGFKRNICGILAYIVVVFISIYLVLLLSTVGLFIPFIFTFALLFFIGSYCCYPVIDKYMIQPYNEEHGIVKNEDTTERIFTDRG